MLSESIRCIPLHGSCLLVGVPPTGCLRVALFVTERYLWSSRPLTSHFLPALFFCADRLLCARAIAQASSGGCAHPYQISQKCSPSISNMTMLLRSCRAWVRWRAICVLGYLFAQFWRSLTLFFVTDPELSSAPGRIPHLEECPASSDVRKLTLSSEEPHQLLLTRVPDRCHLGMCVCV